MEKKEKMAHNHHEKGNRVTAGCGACSPAAGLPSERGGSARGCAGWVYTETSRTRSWASVRSATKQTSREGDNA